MAVHRLSRQIFGAARANDCVSAPKIVTLGRIVNKNVRFAIK
jgi:hypothetical protein